MKPNINGREQIFLLYLQKLKLNKVLTFYSQHLFALTHGFVGDVCNEAALIATRNNEKQITMHHFEVSIDRINGVLEKKNKVFAILCFPLHYVHVANALFLSQMHTHR